MLKAEGEVFSAGLDLASMQNLFVRIFQGPSEENKAAVRAGIDAAQEAYLAMHRCPKPIVGMFQGACIGGGFGLVSGCDLRFALETSVFSIKEAKYNIVADVGSIQWMAKELPTAVLKEMCLTARDVPASEMYSYGIINRLFSDYASMEEEVMKLAKELSKRSSAVLNGIVEEVEFSVNHSFLESMKHVADNNTERFFDEELRAKMMAG